MAWEGTLLRIFPEGMRQKWEQAAGLPDLQEIRLRSGRPILLYRKGTEWYMDRKGNLTGNKGQAAEADREEIERLISYVCDSSMYAYEEEIRQGYLTLPGGHRMGLVGEAVLEETGRVRKIKHISGINIRIAHEKKGVADPLMPWLYRDGSFLNTLLVSPPCGGKTTMLRDIVRQISDGNSCAPGMTVGIVDERSEIAGTYRGIHGNDVGMRTDVLDGCPKAPGMMMLVRSMSPRVVAVDELGGEEEIGAVRHVLQCGCGILATMHAGSVREAAGRLACLPKQPGAGFERYVMLGRNGGDYGVRSILDENFRALKEGELC